MAAMRTTPIRTIAGLIRSSPEWPRLARPPNRRRPPEDSPRAEQPRSEGAAELPTSEGAAELPTSEGRRRGHPHLGATGALGTGGAAGVAVTDRPAPHEAQNFCSSALRAAHSWGRSRIQSPSDFPPTVAWAIVKVRLDFGLALGDLPRPGPLRPGHSSLPIRCPIKLSNRSGQYPVGHLAPVTARARPCGSRRQCDSRRRAPAPRPVRSEASPAVGRLRRAMSGQLTASVRGRTGNDPVGESRRQLIRDALAIAAYALPVGLVYGWPPCRPISRCSTSSCRASWCSPEGRSSRRREWSRTAPHGWRSRE